MQNTSFTKALEDKMNTNTITEENFKTKKHFKKGDRVSFVCSRTGTHAGTVAYVRRNRIHVMTYEGYLWDVDIFSLNQLEA